MTIAQLVLWYGITMMKDNNKLQKIDTGNVTINEDTITLVDYLGLGSKYERKELEERKVSFLKEYLATCSFKKASENTGIPVATAYTWKYRDELFLAMYNECDRLVSILLESEAIRRAYDGVDKPVYQQGELVGMVREYSDSLMKMLLAAKMPERYNPKVEGNQAQQVNIVVRDDRPDDAPAATRIEILQNGRIDGPDDGTEERPPRG